MLEYMSKKEWKKICNLLKRKEEYVKNNNKTCRLFYRGIEIPKIEFRAIYKNGNDEEIRSDFSEEKNLIMINIVLFSNHCDFPVYQPPIEIITFNSYSITKKYLLQEIDLIEIRKIDIIDIF